MIKFRAGAITVLRFTKKADRQGAVIPPECHAKVPTHPIPIWFNHDHRGMPVGFAMMRRSGNRLVADIEVTTEMSDAIKAMEMIKMLRPSIEFDCVDLTDNKIMAIEVTGMSLIASENADPKIKPLGEAVRCATILTRSGLH